MEIKFVCVECGTEFVEQADYAIPGIQGHIVKSDGTLVTFIDPSEPHICTDCKEKRIEELLKAMKEKEKNV